MLPQVEPASADVTVTVFGDTHGQLHDVLHALRSGGDPGPLRLYIFNGDFVDRWMSLHLLSTLLCSRGRCSICTFVDTAFCVNAHHAAQISWCNDLNSAGPCDPC